MPSTFFELSFNLRRLRTTPARKPRTECCCQPVVVTVVRKRLKLKLNSKKVDGNRVYRIAGGDGGISRQSKRRPS